MTVYCASTNSGKLREFRHAFAHFAPGVELMSVPGMESIEPCEETGATFEENAAQKAIYYSDFAPGLVFADDSGLEVDALGGAPGVYSARYGGPGATDEDNNRLLLQRLEGAGDRSARFVCVAGVAERGKLLATFRGTVDGQIAGKPCGNGSFGYDPLFYYPDFGYTFGEVSGDAKLEVSHRGRALEAMCRWLSQSSAPSGM